MALLVSLGAAAVVLPAGLDEVARLFATGRYDQARALDPAEMSHGRPGEATLWAMQLAREPREALRDARGLAEDDHLPLAVRTRAALDAATIAFAQDRPGDALEILLPFLKERNQREPVTGDVPLLAGIAARTLRMPADARRYLERIDADDPAYAAARYQLGRLALDAGEHARALEAFRDAAAATGGKDLLAEAGRWQALRHLGRAAEALSVEQKILRQAPSSLAAVEVRATLARAGGRSPVPGAGGRAGAGSKPR